MKIESKEEARKRGVRSPDRAEALMLAFADTTPGIIEFVKREALRVAREEEELRTGRKLPPLPGEQSKNPNRLVELYRKRLREIDEALGGDGSGSAIL